MPSPPNGTAARRAQPLSAQPRTASGKMTNKTPRASPGSVTPSSGGSSGAPVSDIARTTKKIGKAVRSGKSGAKTKTKTNKEKIGDGPEAELSEEEDDLDEYDEDEPETTGTTEGGLTAPSLPYGRVVEGAEGKSVAKSEINMDSLIAGAKVRPDHPKISRGYEMLTNPAARMVITFDRDNAPRLGRKDSLAASITFSDESEWENVQFEMDEFEGTTEPVIIPAIPGGGKHAYADIVKGPKASVSV